MSGYDKAKEIADKLKEEVKAEEEASQKNEVEVRNQLATISNNAELAKMYTDSANMGAANLGGELPLLKVHSVGKSTKNELADGTEPTDGFLFYKPTGEQFEELTVHILTISKGFRAKGMEGEDEKFNQIIGGIIADGKFDKPFIMYMTGTKLSHMWEFGKAAAKYTRGKPVKIPMFALSIKLTTEKVANNYGKSWIIKFEIEKEEGYPKLIMDAGEFQFLKDSVETVEETIDGLIESKTSQGQAEVTEDLPFK